MEHTVKILRSKFINHNVKQFVVERPAGYSFHPGQATDVSLPIPGWEGELRPFTFTSLPDDKHLEFTIKIYDDHPGVTHQLGKLNAGAELILHEVFGAIQYKGPGVFLAGGAGVTPFIAILRNLARERKLKGNTLIFSNQTPEDVILKDEFRNMLRDRFICVFTRDHVIGFRDKRIDRHFLIEKISDFGQNFYVCGPDAFVNDIKGLLLDLGANAQALIFEK